MVKIGQVINTHGHKGELKIQPLTDQPERFFGLEELMLQTKQGVTTYHVGEVRLHKGHVILQLKEVPDMNAAERLKGAYVVIAKEDRLDLEEDRYYISDLLGVEVYEDGRHLGAIVDVLQPGGHDVYVVAVGDKQVYIPAVKAMVLSVDIPGKIMQVTLPDGLIE